MGAKRDTVDEGRADEGGASGDALALQANVQQAVDLLDGATVEVLDPRLAGINIERNKGEEGDENMPLHLHNAVELFVQTGKVDAAQRLQRCTARFFAMADGQCPGVKATRMGRACICWSCGHCGLGRLADRASNEEPRVCNACGEADDTNFVQVRAPGGVEGSWVEPVSVVAKQQGSCVIEEVTSGGAPDTRQPGAGKEQTEDPEVAELAKSVAEKASLAHGGGATESPAAPAKQVAPKGKPAPPNPRFRAIHVVPNEGEAGHARFPRTLFAASELLQQVGLVEPALRMQECVGEFLSVLDEGPQAAGAKGQGFVCFTCGFCGLAPTDDASKTGSEGATKACRCTACGSESHTNLVELRIPTPNGEAQMPWMTRAQAADP